MTKNELHAFMTERGWTLKQPHYSSYHNDKSPNVRYKVQKLVLRKERKGNFGWVRVASGYISQLSITDEGKIRGLGA